MCIVTRMAERPLASRRTGPRTAYVSFLAFGSFWGAWGAALPGFKEQTQVTDGRLGTALLFVGAGALPAMLLVGRAVDRWGTRTGAVLMLALGLSGVVAALGSHDSVSLSLCLLLVGATSGAADVAMNAAAGSAEASSGVPVITRAHGCFSLAVVLSSLLAGLLRSLGAGLVVPFLVVVAAAVVAAATVLLDARHGAASAEPVGAATPHPSGGQSLSSAWRIPAFRNLVAVGLLGALAFAVENAHQSWGAVFLHDALNTPTWLTAAAPATFAAVAAAARFAASAAGRVQPLRLLLGGCTLAVVGTLVVASAPTVASALLGLALAAAGTSVLFPTLLRIVTAGVQESRRGRATSVVSTTAYLGFLLGPVFLGALADRWSLRGALVGVAGLALVLAAWAPVVTRRAARLRATSF